eukprot:SAG31_NODE_1741_length_7387_cov_6.330132_6_plen_91_part_00
MSRHPWAYEQVAGKPVEQSSVPRVSQHKAVMLWISASREKAHAAVFRTNNSKASSSRFSNIPTRGHSGAVEAWCPCPMCSGPVTRGASCR